MEEEIIKLKKIIEKENAKNNLMKKLIKIKNETKNRILLFSKFNSKKLKGEKEKFSNIKKSKIITFSGNSKSGKTTLSLLISQCLTDKKYKVLLIDADFEKHDLSIILRKDRKLNNYNNRKYKKVLNKEIKKINKYNKLKSFKYKINYYKTNKYIEKNTKKINKNFYFLNDLNNREIKDKNLNAFFEILKKKYNFIIIDLSEKNKEKINIEILKNS